MQYQWGCISGSRCFLRIMYSNNRLITHCQLQLDMHTVGQLFATLQVRQQDNTVGASLHTLLQLPGDVGGLQG